MTTLLTATRWFKNGDHPADYAEPVTGLEKGAPYIWDRIHQQVNDWEGQVVRRFNHPEFSSSAVCPHCKTDLHTHGWIDDGERGHVVCPGDWILTISDGSVLPCKPALFEFVTQNLILTKP